MHNIEFLTVPRIIELKDKLVPLFQMSCDGNEISKDDTTPDEILALALTEQAVVFAGYEDEELDCVLAIQFYVEGGKKGADVIALAGRGLVKFKKHYWHVIIAWLRANGVKYLDAYVDQKHTKMYQNRYGFDKACGLVRMKL